MARFIVSHRLAGKSQDERDASLSALNEAGRQIRGFAGVLAESQPKTQGRGVMFIEADSKDVAAKRADMSPAVIVEPEVPRIIARYFPMLATGLFPMAAETPQRLFFLCLLERFFCCETDNSDPRPTGGVIQLASFRNSIRRIALLPFALLVELLAPVPVGVLNLESGAAISVSN